MRLVTDLMDFCAREAPAFNTISISGYHMREAGCTAVQEVAFTLADGIAYVDAAIKAGLDVDAFAGRLSFFFNAHNGNAKSIVEMLWDIELIELELGEIFRTYRVRNLIVQTPVHPRDDADKQEEHRHDQ